MGKIKYFSSENTEPKELDVLQMIIDLIFAHEMKLDKIEKALTKVTEELEAKPLDWR
jgi:hypothetical protein